MRNSEKFLVKQMKTCISYSSTSTVTMSSDKNKLAVSLSTKQGIFQNLCFAFKVYQVQAESICIKKQNTEKTYYEYEIIRPEKFGLSQKHLKKNYCWMYSYIIAF